jgi:hypothetical protein
MMSQIEEMWGHQNTLFNIISDTESWNKKHGPDWTFADVPYHLEYYNRDLIARGLEYGPDYPEAERLAFPGIEELNAWNAQEFAQRPAGQTAQESVERLRACWDDIRALASGMSDADLERPFYVPFFNGTWLTARDAFGMCLGHEWSEFTQLRIHLGFSEPVPSPAITTQYLGMITGMTFPMALNKEAAADQQYTAVFAFTDPGVSPFTIRVADGAAAVAPGQAADADLVLTQSAETFEKTFRRMVSFPDAISSGAIQVSDMESLAAFGQLFPM